MRCSKCGATMLINTFFCSMCGQPASKEDTLPYVGERISKARFRFTFAPVEGTFSSLDSARDAARHSHWNEDSEFGHVEIEEIGSAVPPETYPLICSCGECVSKTDNGRCSECGKVDWKKR